MTITTRDQLIDALANNNSQIVFEKNPLANTVASQIFSLWAAGGVPGAGAAPTTAAVCTKALAGSLSFANQTAPATSYLAWLFVSMTISSHGAEIHDRLAHMGGLSGIVTTAQGALSLATSDPGADRLGASDYSDVSWWLEWYTATGSTSVNATVNVTYDDDSTGNLTAFSLGATARAGRMFPLASAVAGRWIKAVNSVTLSASTLTAGNFGITATRMRTAVFAPVANYTQSFDWATTGLPKIPNDSCLQLVLPCLSTSTPTVRGGGKIIHG